MLVPTVAIVQGWSFVEIKAVNPLEASTSSSPFELYAGRADATVLRALLRKSALERWTTASLDVKTAFLLAPRRDASQRLLITGPPKVLIEAGVCKQGEIW